MGCNSTKVAAVAADPQPGIDFFDRYELAHVLGRGAYGTVHMAYSVDTADHFAVKVLDLNKGGHGQKTPARLRKDARAEEKVLARVSGHPNVVGLQDSFFDAGFAYFVMELCTGSLFTAWEAEPQLNENTYGPYFKQMAEALAHIHAVGVVHRDVKQDNFIVGGPDGRTVKLCDSGLSAIMASDGKVSGHVGTAPYMAPEMLAQTGAAGPPADVWSLGVIVYTVFFAAWPYQPRKNSRDEMKRAIQEGLVPPRFAPARRGLRNVVSRDGIRFVHMLLDRNPLTRPSAASCSEMAYLNERNERMASLTPHFWAAVHMGAFNIKTPKADETQAWQLMTLQSNAQSRRLSCFSSQDDDDSRWAWAIKGLFVLDSAKANATVAEEKLKAVQDRVNQATKEFEAAESKDAAAGQAVEAGEKAVQEDEQEIETGEKKLEEAKQELSKIENEHNTSIEAADEANETEVDLEAKANELEAKANEALEAAEAAQKDAKEAKNNATAAEERVEEVTNETKTANTTVDKEEVDLEGCEKQLQAAKEKLAKLEQDKNATQTTENQTKTVAEAMSQTVANVTKTQEALQKELDAAQAEFDAAKEAYDNAATSESSDEASLNKAAGTLKRFRSGYAEKGEKLQSNAITLRGFTALVFAALSMLVHVVM